MPLLRMFHLLINPRAGWQAVREAEYSTPAAFLGHTVPLALIPPICGYLGTTTRGWDFGSGQAVRLTVESATRISIFYFLALLIATLSVAWAIHWMARTYGARQSFSRGLVLASMTATPLFLVGLAQLTPELWLNLVLGLPALAWSVALFFTGVPIMLEIPEERGFLLSCAVMAFGLVALVGMIVVTVLLWGVGFAPSFTR